MKIEINNTKLELNGLHEKASLPILILACGVLIAFFMPWVQWGPIGFSGYQMGKLGSDGNFVWILPILAVTTIILSFVTNNRPLGVATGLTPFAGIVYEFSKLSGDASSSMSDGFLGHILDLLGIGAYLGLICCVGLIIVGLDKKLSRFPLGR